MQIFDNIIKNSCESYQTAMAFNTSLDGYLMLGSGKSFSFHISY
jgi:hypothetical protein